MSNTSEGTLLQNWGLVTPAYTTPTLSLRAQGDLSSLRIIYGIEPVIAALAMILLAPAILTIGVAIALLSGRSPLVRHRRVGWRGSPLPMLKFRTMWDRRGEPRAVFGVEEVSDHIPESKDGDDPRVTSRFAAFCRRHSLDELPQLYHVARGQMSFVGPRPITQAELETHYGPSAEEVLRLRPGLTGLWQVLGRSRLTYERRRRLDLVLVRRACAGLYFRILLRSFPRVLSGTDAR